MASVLHEDTKYRRRGEQHGFRSRVGYAISRAAVTRTDTGASTVNWSNFAGTALSVGLSNAYCPVHSRNLNATAINCGTSAAGTGFGNLFPNPRRSTAGPARRARDSATCFRNSCRTVSAGSNAITSKVGEAFSLPGLYHGRLVSSSGRRGSQISRVIGDSFRRAAVRAPDSRVRQIHAAAHADYRQVAVIDQAGRTASYSGARTLGRHAT